MRGIPPSFQMLPLRVEVMFLFPNGRGQLMPTYREFGLDNEADLIDWRLNYKATQAIQAKVRIVESRNVTPEEFVEVDNRRKLLTRKVEQICYEHLNHKAAPISKPYQITSEKTDHVHQPAHRCRQDTPRMPSPCVIAVTTNTAGTTAGLYGRGSYRNF